MRARRMIVAAAAAALVAAAPAGAWPGDRPHPGFPAAAVVPETTTVWEGDQGTGRVLQEAVYCSMSLAGVFKAAPNIWGSGATSCTFNVTRVQLKLCLYRTAWLSLMGCGQNTKDGSQVSYSLAKDCRAGTQKYYLSGQSTSYNPNGAVVGPLGWAGGQTYTCS